MPAKATIRDPLAGANKLEREYARELEARRKAGVIKSWAYEAIKLRLADGAWYTPDFMVVMADDSIEIHETKGFMREAARVRLKVAAELHPFRFYLVRHARDTWSMEVI